MTDPEEAEVAAWLQAQAERSVETACARVFLAGETVLKVKRRVDLGYLDFTTLDRRLWAVERELAFNRAWAPDVYRRVRRLTRAADGGLELDGPGALVEPVLEMRRFDEDALLAQHPERVDGDLAETLGRLVADVHAQAPRRGSGAALPAAVASNAELLAGLAARLGRADVDRLLAATAAELARQAPLLEARAAAGLVRRCHGDLHLGNIFLEDGRPVLFDCIEFSDLFCEIDVQYDLAFLLMDLDFRGRGAAACRLLSAWLDQAARSSSEVWDGLAALPLMLSVRAAVRAHVTANGGRDEEARAYLAAALSHLRPSPPRLVAVGGYSGSGKTAFARAVAPALGAAPGAVVLRTDEIRKRRFGAAPRERLPAQAYGPQADEAVFAELLDLAGRLLRAGRAVALDATFMPPGLRAAAEDLARAEGVPFAGAWLEAPPEVLAERVARRTGDASDATVEVVEAQLLRGAGGIGWERLDAGPPVDEVAAAWLASQVRGVARPGPGH